MAYEPYDVLVIDGNDGDMCNAYMVCNAHEVYEDGGMRLNFYMLYDNMGVNDDDDGPHVI